MKLLVLIMTVVFFTGCVTSRKEYTIQLKKFGKPVAGAKIVFDNSNLNSDNYVTDKDGKVTIVCPPNEKCTFFKNDKQILETNSSSFDDSSETMFSIIAVIGENE